MNLSKIVQIYISLLSVFLLVLIGAGTYIWKTGQITTSANVISQNQVTLPSISLNPEKSNIKNGEMINLDLRGDFTIDPFTTGTITLVYPNDKVDYIGISTTDGILGEPTYAQNNTESGKITLNFAPATGIANSGLIAKINFKAKSVGDSLFDFSLIPSENNIATASQSTITPQLESASVSIE